MLPQQMPSVAVGERNSDSVDGGRKLTVTGWHNTGIPATVSPADIQALLDSCPLSLTERERQILKGIGWIPSHTSGGVCEGLPS
jgi:hypothetical protein